MKKSFSATIDNLKNIRSMIVDFLNNHKLPVKEIKEIELGTNEAVTNIIKHSYKEENKKNIIEVELEFLENKVIIHLYDNGTPVNEKKIKPCFARCKSTWQIHLSRDNNCNKCKNSSTKSTKNNYFSSVIKIRYFSNWKLSYSPRNS